MFRPYDAEAASDGAAGITLLVASGRMQYFRALLAPLADEPDIRLCGQWVDRVEQAQYWLRSLHPTIILLDQSSLGQTCAEWLSVLHNDHRGLPVILLCDRDCRDYFDMIVQYDVSGCLNIGIPSEKIAQAIRTVAGGGLWLPRELLARGYRYAQSIANREPTTRSSAPAARISLSPREQSIGEMVIQGQTNKEIARQLRISEDTVKKHLKHLFEKLGVHRRSQVAASQTHWET